MKIEDIEVEIIIGENTSAIVTEEILKLYSNNVSKILDIPTAVSKPGICEKYTLNNK